MQAEKLSVSLPETLVRFIEKYKLIHQCKSRSQVIEVALQLLQEQELEQAYREAIQEVDPDWELTLANGLTNETW
ncbi:MAG: CopG family transcriptional regulator [Chroococcidiopsidaceae cyanobacterium CP_BM_RX_35]|nr:CopG family transcriptional regulator [Chroococcidiopsidaceae cyanobacterium CP_BM_RX_35]